MSPTWIEPPPKTRKTGCLGKGCLMLVVFAIENNVARIQVSVPMEKAGLRGRFLNGQLQVKSAPDRNPRNIEITEVALGGFSDRILNTLLGFRSLRSYADEYATQYDIRSFAIEDNKVVIESGGKIPGTR